MSIKTGNFTINHDIKADILDGAIGCAFGNHIWRGNNHDFQPNHTKLQTKTNTIALVDNDKWSQLLKIVDWVSRINGMKLINMKNIQIWVNTKYHFHVLPRNNLIMT